MIAYLFPGQGSQHVGMGRDLVAASPLARAVFDRADAILGFALSTLCFAGPETTLTETVNQQPALFVTGVAAWRIIEPSDQWPPADFVAGHSLGEFTALVAAGALSFDAGLALVRRRGELMQAAGESSPGGMSAVLGLDAGPLRDICARVSEELDRPVQVANDNCPGQIVLSGDKTALARAEEMAGDAGARKVVRLPITIAAHSQLMATAADAFAAAVDAVPIDAPQTPIVGNVNAGLLETPDEIRAELKAQLTSAVRWTESMRFLRDHGAQTFIEVGPGDVLSKLMRRIDRDAERRSFAA